MIYLEITHTGDHVENEGSAHYNVQLRRVASIAGPAAMMSATTTTEPDRNKILKYLKYAKLDHNKK